MAEYDGAGNVLRRYVHGPGVDEPLIWYESATLAARRLLRSDHQGSIIAVTDSAVACIAINSYDEYGVPAQTNLGRFAYTGQIILPDLGFYHYKARIYSPTLGRFRQTDPVGYTDQMNLYGYVNNNPVNKMDPSGLMSADDCQKYGGNCSVWEAGSSSGPAQGGGGPRGQALSAQTIAPMSFSKSSASSSDGVDGDEAKIVVTAIKTVRMRQGFVISVSLGLWKGALTQ